MRINCKIHEIWKIRLQIKSFYYFHNLFALKSWAGSLNLNVCIIKWGLYFSHIAVKNKKSNICEVLAAQSCLTFCHPMDCSFPGSSVHGIFQVRTLERVVISYSRGSFWPRDRTRISSFQADERGCSESNSGGRETSGGRHNGVI